MTNRLPVVRPSEPQLRKLMASMELDLVRLTECLVSPGWRLVFGSSDNTSLHYCLEGHGRIIVEGHPPAHVEPHTLVVIPAGKPFRFEVDSLRGAMTTLELPKPSKNDPHFFGRLEAGEGTPRLTLICGHFRCRHVDGADLFANVQVPIVEQFAAEDRVEGPVKEAFEELLAQEQGSGTMAANLLKQVVVKLLRRSIASNELWVERLSVLDDPQIARAFAQMIVRPGSAHTSDSVATVAGMSRSVFMERFTRIFGDPPITVLRRLRSSTLARSSHAHRWRLMK